MNKLHFLPRIIHNFFNILPSKIAKQTGFIKRKRKLNASSFLKAMIFGNLSNQNCSIENMCQILREDSVNLTKQGLDFRFNDASVDFMSSMFNIAMKKFKKNLQVPCAILEQFKNVKLLDSTNIKLPNCMRNFFRGCGATFSHCESNIKSAIKLQVLFDYLHQEISRIDVKEGIRSDQGYRDYLSCVEKGDLFIFDLGYFVPKAFETLSSSGAFFISRYKADTNIYDLYDEKIDLISKLENSDSWDTEVLLGRESKMRVRIVAIKLSEQQAKYRKNKAFKLAKEHGYKVSDKNKKLLNWSIFITNVSVEQIKKEELYSVYKVRWQIELLFKLYKSHIKIQRVKGRTNSFRVLCELYAKLCVATIFYGIFGKVYDFEEPELSPTKAMLELQSRAREFLTVIGKGIQKIKNFLLDLAIAWLKFCTKDRYRIKRISTLSLLRSLGIDPLT